MIMLDRINNRAYGSDKRQAFQSTQANIDLMLRYKKAFDYIRNGKKKLQALVGMAETFKQEKFLTPKQMSFINENIYESWWQGLSRARADEQLQGATTHHDMKKSIRY